PLAHPPTLPPNPRRTRLPDPPAYFLPGPPAPPRRRVDAQPAAERIAIPVRWRCADRSGCVPPGSPCPAASWLHRGDMPPVRAAASAAMHRRSARPDAPPSHPPLPTRPTRPPMRAGRPTHNGRRISPHHLPLKRLAFPVYRKHHMRLALSRYLLAVSKKTSRSGFGHDGSQRGL